MVNKKYRAGRRFEYEVKKYFEKLGWLVFRTAGSHGLADIIAVKESDTLLIQCKYGSMPTKAEIGKLWRYNWHKFDIHISVLIAHRKPREKLKLYEPSLAKKYRLNEVYFSDEVEMDI